MSRVLRSEPLFGLFGGAAGPLAPRMAVAGGLAPILVFVALTPRARR